MGAERASGSSPARTGIVVIGRNEGERLVRCLDALESAGRPVVYVDSGSTDGSTASARERGVDALELDSSAPFTAARARNRGFAWLRERQPALAFVQFVDGDSALCPGWLDAAEAELRARADVAIVCGALSERGAEASAWKRLVALEWEGPTGEVDACGGIAMVRASAFAAVGGFRDDLGAGEEPELCARIRAGGGRVVRIAAPMAVHDAGATGIRQWWRRAVRAGHAYAEVAALHRHSPERTRRREVYSIALFGGALPLAVAAGSALVSGWSALGLLAYVALAARVFRRRRRRGDSTRDAALYAAATTLGKLPEFVGVLRYARRRLARRPARSLPASAEGSARP
jgi:GT2 family glycosyltransferase